MRYILLGIALSATPTWAYETHKECIEAQIVIYENLNSLRHSSSDFGMTFRSQDHGLDKAREVDSEWKSVVEGYEQVSKLHADYCKSYPADE